MLARGAHRSAFVSRPLSRQLRHAGRSMDQRQRLPLAPRAYDRAGAGIGTNARRNVYATASTQQRTLN
eukprot:1849191-Lingulodinium_polyedra.AAC.1